MCVLALSPVYAIMRAPGAAGRSSTAARGGALCGVVTPGTAGGVLPYQRFQGGRGSGKTAGPSQDGV